MALRPTKLPIVHAAKGAAKAVAKISHATGRSRGLIEARRSSPQRRLGVFVAGTGAGAAAEYLLDPQHGKRRRHVLRDRALAKMRRGSRQAAERSRAAAARIGGTVAEATGPGRDASRLNDPALAAKVQSELFRAPDAPKDRVSVNVEDRVVCLRGELESQEQIDQLVRAASAIEGVREVESLLHLPDRPAA